MIQSNVRSQQECAELADNTDGGLFWVFERDTRECKVKRSDEKKGKGMESVAGYRGCGQLTQDKWDRMMSSDCKREYSVGIPDSETILSQTVGSQQDCAELAVETVGGVFWDYNQATGECSVKKSDKGKEGIEGIVTGNRECGLMTRSKWTEIMFSDCQLKDKKRYSGQSITTEEVESARICARLSVSTVGGLYWSYHKTTRFCSVFAFESSQVEEDDRVSGNRECGLGEEYVTS